MRFPCQDEAFLPGECRGYQEDGIRLYRLGLQELVGADDEVLAQDGEGDRGACRADVS